VDDLNFRAEFRRALDPLAPPAPWLASAVREGMRERQRRRGAARRGFRVVAQPALLLPVVAVLVVVAILIAVIAGSHLLNNHVVPVRPPQHGLAGPATCPKWSTQPQSAGTAAATDRMITPSIGWAQGGLRTTDGGAHWSRVAPPDMFADAPPGTDPAAYPPSYADFFLDSQRAWIAYGYPSRVSCFDHLVLYSTDDAGATWKRSQFFNPPVQADSSLQLQLFFIDPQHGWLFVLGSGRLVPDWFVYATDDGGTHWQEQSQLPLISSWCSVRFISLTVGFLGGCENVSGPAPSLVETRDGGKTWMVVTLPVGIGNGFSVLAPVFFDQSNGVVGVAATVNQGNTSTSVYYLARTADGGLTWSLLPPLNLPGFVQVAGFIDAQHFVALEADGKGGITSAYVTADGGRTWTQATGAFPDSFQSYPQITFVDAQHGFLDVPSQKYGSPPIVMYATNDAGGHWTNVNPHLS
jgi:hypothetical protein